MDINNRAREFAQGILLEAVDASYALGYVDILRSSLLQFKDGAKAVFKKFAKEVAAHWFKHLKPQDLHKIKIYDRVRDALDDSFTTDLKRIILKIENIHSQCGRFVNYAKYPHNTLIWG